jgi:hypothetical protein
MENGKSHIPDPRRFTLPSINIKFSLLENIISINKGYNFAKGIIASKLLLIARLYLVYIGISCFLVLITDKSNIFIAL